MPRLLPGAQLPARLAALMSVLLFHLAGFGWRRVAAPGLLVANCLLNPLQQFPDALKLLGRALDVNGVRYVQLAGNKKVRRLPPGLSVN